MPIKKGHLADECEEIAWRLAQAMPEKIGKASLSQMATSFGIMIDKMQLLRGLPTSITESVERQDITVILQSALDEAIDITSE